MRERDVLFSAILVFLLLMPLASAVEGLVVDDIDVYVNGRHVRDIDRDGGDVIVHPGDILGIDVRVENRHPRRTQFDIDHVYRKTTVTDIDHYLPCHLKHVLMLCVRCTMVMDENTDHPCHDTHLQAFLLADKATFFLSR